METFAALVKAFAGVRDGRRINEVHLHHTWKPHHDDFRRAKAELGSAEAAGRKLVLGMWRNHVEERGFADIAQHVSIDPEGGVWLGRPWSQAPASAKGFNGTSRLGPFMIETIGDFDRGRDRLEGAQREAVVAVTALVQRAFGLPPQAVRFHSEMSAKSCPGTGVGKAALIAELGAYAPPSRAPARELEAADGPLPDEQLVEAEVPTDLLMRVLAPAPEGARGELDGELDDGPPAATALEGPTPGRGAPSEPGLARGGPPLTPEMLRDLRPHVVNLTQGRFSESGLFRSDASSVAEIFRRHLPEWLEARGGDGPAKVVLYAHGGLVDEAQALRQAHAQLDWWRANGVYPVFFIWETGPLEIPLQAMSRLFGGKGRDGTRAFVSDGFWEQAARAVGKPLWSGMQASAARASEPEGGAWTVARHLADARKKDPKLEVHMVGHSAGAIFHAHFVRELAAQGVPIETLQLLAPACTTELYKAQVMPRVDGTAVKRVRLLTMARPYELVDDTMRHVGYGKSILYAVSHAFEDRQPTPILGLEESLRADPQLSAHFGLDGAGAGAASVVWSMTGDTLDVVRSNSKTHGFDWEPDSMTATLLGVLGRGVADGLTPFPARPRDLAAVVSDGAWSQVEATLAAAGAWGAGPVLAQPAPPTAVAAAYPMANGGGRKSALSFGIDAYRDAPLQGCVNDTKLWRSLLERRGYQVQVHPNEEATRAGFLGRVGDWLAAAQAGDQLFLHYSGHGTFFPDLDGDEEDGRDEAIVPIDYLEAGCIMDDDLRALFGRLPAGVDLTAVFDCCHSASNARFGVGRSGNGGRARFLPSTPQMRAAQRAKRRALGARAMGGAGQEDMRHAQFAACLDSQVALEDQGYGRLSLVATRVLDGERGFSRRQAQTEIERAFAQAGYSDQTPMLEGPQRLKDGPVFPG